MNSTVNPLVPTEPVSAIVDRENEADSDDIRPFAGFIVAIMISSVLWSGLIWAAIGFWQ